VPVDEAIVLDGDKERRRLRSGGSATNCGSEKRECEIAPPFPASAASSSSNRPKKLLERGGGGGLVALTCKPSVTRTDFLHLPLIGKMTCDTRKRMTTRRMKIFFF